MHYPMVVILKKIKRLILIKLMRSLVDHLQCLSTLDIRLTVLMVRIYLIDKR